MSHQDHDDFDPVDLIARARRGLLSRAEHDALAAALAESPELAAAYRAGVEIDRASAVQGGDEALIARAADAAMARVADMTSRTRMASTPASTSSGPRWAMVAAALLSVVAASGIAAAFFTGVVEWPFRSGTSEREPAAVAERAPSDTRKPPQAEQARAPQPPSQEDLSQLHAIRVEDRAAPSAPEPRARKATEPGDAGELFRDANAARRAGELSRARRTYAQLIDEHPTSDEAGLARVSLGKLLLAAGDARGAERELRRYLAAGGGQLEEEALVGQAQALERLKRPQDERAAWQRLLATHPSSVYAAQAKQRLAALAEAAP